MLKSFETLFTLQLYGFSQWKNELVVPKFIRENLLVAPVKQMQTVLPYMFPDGISEGKLAVMSHLNR